MTAVLVDTSVWRHHFAGTSRASNLAALLDEDGAVLTHPAVLGELVLGGLSRREESLLERLPGVEEISSEELLSFVRDRNLGRKGIGWVDCHLLASALVASVELWSLDKQLVAVAGDLGLAFRGK